MSDTFSAICPTRELAHRAAQDAYRCAQAMLASGELPVIECRLSEEPITIKQRKFLKDIVFGQIAEQVRVGGERYAKDVWAEHYRREFLGFRYEVQKLPGAKRATPRKVRNSTEELGIRKYAEYTERVIAHATTDHGVEFHFTREEGLLRGYPGARK